MRRAKPTGTTGVLRVDARSSRLASRLQRGDIAVLDHADLDAPTADVLLSCGVAAVVNAAPSSTGRYPNLGPAVLVGAGVPVLSGVGSHVLSVLHEGSEAWLDGDSLWVQGQVVARGIRLDEASVAQSAARSRGGIAAQLADLSANAAGFLVDERTLLLDGIGLPNLDLEVAGRHVLVVGASYGASEDLQQLKRYRRRYKPLVVAVDAGGDLLIRMDTQVDLLVGDPETMSDEALKSAGAVVLRAQATGTDRVHDLAVPFATVATRAASEDLALLLVLHGSAAVVVTAGLPRTLEELLDRGREAAASSLTTRFALGSRLVQAQAARAMIPRRSWRLSALCVLLLAALVGAAVGQDALVSAWHQVGP